jgi:hypothetical protein
MILLFASVVAASNVLHISDLHLDTMSDPQHYGPDVFCRSPDNQPDEATMQRTAKFMMEDFGTKVARKPHRQQQHHVVSGFAPTPAPTHNFRNKKVCIVANSLCCRLFLSFLHLCSTVGTIVTQRRPC